ncbi:hypothetical protein HYDPIDRAFT_81586 [Hydnomerulius pinastri MD-312]|nr:hypothetical protein HYDPIDRAFT_81586 [Hydnomerulius pinastri MD-312]
MDELVHHCLRELSFDGDLGCNVSRLRDFIVGFYTTHDGHPQVVDDAFCAFVWSVVVQQPSVRVGVVPPGVTSEVYVAPQTSAKRKAAAKGEEVVEEAPPTLQLVEDAHGKTLENLKHQYGDDLRIAVDPETSFAAITGSHIRPPKLSPMVYSALQLITRGREDGVTTVELGRKTKYDQKTCFYLIKQLLELGFVIKVRRGGVGNHTVIHKYFVERSALWQQIQEEEARDDEVVVTGENIQPKDANEEVADQAGPSHLPFDPIDARHLSSLSLVKNRIVKLLKASRNYMHASNNLLMTIGFVHPTKTDRRFFQTRLRELIQQGVVEKVLVPSGKVRDRNVKCIRLVTPDNQLPEGTIVVGPQDVDEDEKDVALEEEDAVGQTEVKAHLTIHKQVSNMLEEAGSSGLTLNEICASLGNFDKRTIELLLTRASKSRPPVHLSDLGTADLMETYGRERRHKYFTLAAYKSVMASEQLQDTTTSHADANLSHVGEFAEVDPKLFYTSTEKLRVYQDSFKDKTAGKGKKRKRGAEDEAGSSGEESEPPPPKKRGRPRKTPAATDGEPAQPKKRGRPRKHPLPETEETQSVSAAEPKEPKKRGRPPKQKKTQTKPEQEVPAVEEGNAEAPDIPSTPAEFSAQPSSPSKRRAGVVIASKKSSRTSRPGTKPAPVPGVSEHPAEAPVLQAISFQDPPNPTPHLTPEPTPRRSARKLKAVTRDTEPLVSHRKAPPALLKQAASSVVGSSRAEEPQGARPDKGDAMVTDDLQSATQYTDSRLEEDATRSNINISTLRRENELYRVVESMGGIANLHTKEIFEAHTALLDTMTQTGEPTSAPVGTRLDKRTAEAAFKSMENRGRIKMLKTFLVSSSGVSKPACLLYLPDTPQETVNEFLRQLSQNVPSLSVPPIKTLEEPVDYGASLHTMQRSALPLQLLQMEEPGENDSERWCRNTARAEQLFSYDSNTIRDVLLTERTTVSQLYGFIAAKALRLRQLHIHTLQLFEQPTPSPLVVSPQHRIIDTSYYHQDISLATYCSLVAVLVYDEELLKLLGSEVGKQTMIKQLPPSISASLQIGRSRARSRILDLLEMLRMLGLVTPLERTDTLDAPYTCTNSDDDTVAFKDALLDGWSVGTPMTAPQFWRFHPSGPIQLWALSESWPSYWKQVPVNTPTEGAAYWDELYKVSRDQAYAQAAICPSTSYPKPPKTSASLVGCLRRRSSWDNEYVLTWHQKQYLDRHVDMATAQTPLNAEDTDTQLDQICHVISAPHQVVVNYFATAGEKAAHEIEKARRRTRRAQAEEQAQQNLDAKATLLKKAEEARGQREQDWDQLLDRLHPEPVKGNLALRIRAVRNRFMQSMMTKDQEHWEGEIQDAIREAQLVSKKIIPKPKKLAPRLPKPAAGPPPLVANMPEKSIEFLVAQQGPPITQPMRPKGKGKAKEVNADGDVEGKTTPRRPRFHWTREFDELARDASAIIRARCRDCVRLDLSAFDQVFPAVPRNSVRQRVTHLRESAADDLYMKRLEDQWYMIWMQHRGTPHLPDEEPSSPSNFNLIKHIEFLRKHVDKNALRVGFVELEAVVNLTASIEELYARYEVEGDLVTAPAWDFMWNNTVEEGREKQFLRQAFTKEPNMILPPEGTNDEKVQTAEAALKMVFGTPSELYDFDIATCLLRSVGRQPVSIAQTSLLERGVLSRLVRDRGKPKPGRTLKISDANSNAIGGPFTRDVFQDAIALEDIAVEKVVDEMDWPLLASDGDVTTLLQLVSEDQVDFSVDLSHSRAALPKIDWNSKRADDDDIETSIRLKFSPNSEFEPEAPENETSETPSSRLETGTLDSEGHGKTLDERDAACILQTSNGLVNCTRCIETSFSKFASHLSQFEADLARRVLDYGLDIGSQQRTLDLVQKMTSISPPILFWTGCNAPVVVASEYCASWTVIVSEEPLALVSPRRWLDVRGSRIDDAWTAALRAVVGVIVVRPGISQVELRWRLRAVYDRQEVLEVVLSLEQDGALESRTEASLENVRTLTGWPMMVDEKEEQGVFWFIAKNHHWYQV